MKSRQVLGRVAEKKMARDRGARLHPMSGAGRIKDDASTDEKQYEFKNVRSTHVLSGSSLYQLFVRALRQDKEPEYVVYFEEADITATITLERGRRKA